MGICNSKDKETVVEKDKNQAIEGLQILDKDLSLMEKTIEMLKKIINYFHQQEIVYDTSFESDLKNLENLKNKIREQKLRLETDIQKADLTSNSNFNDRSRNWNIARSKKEDIFLNNREYKEWHSEKIEISKKIKDFYDVKIYKINF